MSDKIFLVKYPEPPVPVAKKKPVTIGRAGSNDIILTEHRVSRQHASVQWERVLNAFTVIDRGSHNGTYVNMAKVEHNSPRQLFDGDKIRICSTVFTARIVDSPDEIRHEFRRLSTIADTQPTEIISLSEILSAGERPALSGRLEELCPLELFQMIEVSCKTGVLAITTQTGEATFSIQSGAVVAARFGQSSGVSAVYEILKCSSGTFAFKPQQIYISHPEIQVSTTALLMEGCRMLDESAMSPPPA